MKLTGTNLQFGTAAKRETALKRDARPEHDVRPEGDPAPRRTNTTSGTGITELVLIIDRSGSMHGMEDDTVGGINAVLDRNRDLDGECMVTTILFDNDAQVLHDREPIGCVKPLTSRDYRPNGSTALLDAVGGAIEHIERVQRYMPAGHKAEHVIFAITTDGMENASSKFSYAEVKRMIEKMRKLGWEFLFLGANIDAAAEAERLGIDRNCAESYVCDREGSAAMYCAVADAVHGVRARGAHPCGDGSWKAPISRDRARRRRS